MKGMFIVIEGGDGAGTTTQTSAVTHALHKLRPHIPVAAEREPTGGWIGQQIRKVLRGEVADPGWPALAMLFAADRMDHCETIHALLNEGVDVVCDRYVLSSLVYQGINCSKDLTFVKELNRLTIKPDFTVILEVSSETSRQRQIARGAPKEIFDGDHMREEVLARYLELAKDVDGIIVDGERPVHDVTKDILRVCGFQV